MEKMTAVALASLTHVQVVVHYRPTHCHQTAKINKVKDLTLIFDQCLSPIKTSASVKKRLE